MYLSGGRGSHYVYKGGKYDRKWSISSTMITVCIFSSRDMPAHLVQRNYVMIWRIYVQQKGNYEFVIVNCRITPLNYHDAVEKAML